MPAPLRTVLDDHEKATLSELRIASSVPYRVRDRAQIGLLNGDGWTVDTIAKIMHCHDHTVRAALNRWRTEGLGGLWEKTGRGKKQTWTEADMAFLEACLSEEERTYNSTQLSVKLWEERRVKLSGDRIRILLKKRTTAGNAPARAIVVSKTRSSKPLPPPS